MKTLSTLSALALMLQTVAGQSETELVSLAREKSDPQYAERVRHHLAVKTFVAAREKGDTRAARLMECLLRNGFAIDDFPKAYFVINAPVVPPMAPYVEALRKKGLTEQETEIRLKRRGVHDDAMRRNFIRQMTGIVERNFEEQLLDLAKEPKEDSGFKSVAFPTAKEGEKLLTDLDWMTDDFRKVTAEYTGERRRFSPHPVRLERKDNSLLTIQPVKE